MLSHIETSEIPKPRYPALFRQDTTYAVGFLYTALPTNREGLSAGIGSQQGVALSKELLSGRAAQRGPRYKGPGLHIEAQDCVCRGPKSYIEAWGCMEAVQGCISRPRAVYIEAQGCK